MTTTEPPEDEEQKAETRQQRAGFVLRAVGRQVKKTLGKVAVKGGETLQEASELAVTASTAKLEELDVKNKHLKAKTTEIHRKGEAARRKQQSELKILRAKARRVEIAVEKDEEELKQSKIRTAKDALELLKTAEEMQETSALKEMREGAIDARKAGVSKQTLCLMNHILKQTLLGSTKPRRRQVKSTQFARKQLPPT